MKRHGAKGPIFRRQRNALLLPLDVTRRAVILRLGLSSGPLLGVVALLSLGGLAIRGAVQASRGK
jgi:hypothetical protein